jgi:hypothetical protein
MLSYLHEANNDQSGKQLRAVDSVQNDSHIYSYMPPSEIFRLRLEVLHVSGIRTTYIVTCRMVRVTKITGSSWDHWIY